MRYLSHASLSQTTSCLVGQVSGAVVQNSSMNSMSYSFTVLSLVATARRNS